MSTATEVGALQGREKEEDKDRVKGTLEERKEGRNEERGKLERRKVVSCLFVHFHRPRFSITS